MGNVTYVVRAANNNVLGEYDYEIDATARVFRARNEGDKNHITIEKHTDRMYGGRTIGSKVTVLEVFKEVV